MIRIYKWNFQEEFVEKVLGAVLRTPGLILCDYWHQQCLDYSIPKSLSYGDVTDASLHLAVLVMVISNTLCSIFSVYEYFENEIVYLLSNYLQNTNVLSFV